MQGLADTESVAISGTDSNFIVPQFETKKFYYGYKNLQVGHKLFITVRYNKINFAVQ